MKMKDMNGHQKAAARAIKRTYNEYVGGWYNCYQDGYEDEIPTLDVAKDMVLNDALSFEPKEMRFAGTEFCEAYMEYLFSKDPDVEELWGENGVVTNRTNDEESKEEETMKEVTREEARATVAKWNIKELREHLKDAGVKGISKAKKDELVEMVLDLEEQKDAQRQQGNSVEISKVKMYAFTGMYIGEFEAEVQDGKILVYTESKGELMFDLSTGKELCEESKARYANRVEAV